MRLLYPSLIFIVTVIKFSSGYVPPSNFEQPAWWNTVAEDSSALKIEPWPSATPPTTTSSTTQRWTTSQPWTISFRPWKTTPWTPWTTTSRPWTTPTTPTTTSWAPYTTTAQPTTRPTTPPTTPPTTSWASNTTAQPTTPPTTPPTTSWAPNTTTAQPTTRPPPTTPTTWHPTTLTPPFTSPTAPPFTLPPYQNTARMARFVVHFSNWGSLAYQAEQSEIEGYPSVRVYSISDGYLYAGTGVPYFMVSPLDLTVQALRSNERCSLIVSLSQTSYCDAQSWDPEDPRCVQVILTGRYVKLPDDSDEMKFARRVLWDRHPQMINWFVNKTDHHWEFAKMNIEFITVIDYFGGRKYPGLSEYFSAESPKSYSVQLV